MIKKTSQIYLKVGLNYVPISKFASRRLNLRKSEKPKKVKIEIVEFSQKYIRTNLVMGVEM